MNKFISFFATGIKSVILLSLFIPTARGYSQNLLTNGDFESGVVNGAGFNLNGAGYTFISAPFSGSTSPGNWAITTNPQPMNTSFFISGGDHTTGTGNMMVIDGNTTGGQQRFWRAGNTGGGICGLTVGATYTFSYWIKSVSTSVVDNATRADIDIQFNNANNITLVNGSKLAPLPAAGWVQVVYTFTPTNACVNIEMWNNNTNAVGNDFAIDDLSLTPPPEPLSIAYSVFNVTCPNASDGTIVAYGIGGIAPYTQYTLSGTASATNTTGIFSNLAPGTYSVSVRDNNNANASAPGITITQPANLTVSANTSICKGNSTQLSVSGGNLYNWTASPADPSLTTPTSATPTVSPTQTTVYTVTSNTSSSRNMIYNGDFSLGNTGFYTDYKYYNPINPSGLKRAYGIVTNSQSWFNGFTSCTGRGGSGNMFVADGSAINSGNDKVWCQTVPVIPGKTYTFTYWVQSLSSLTSTFPANLEVVINGTQAAPPSTSPGTTCLWQQRTFTWNSGANTLAQICIYNRSISEDGNDFALDDISFTTTIDCALSNSVTITVNNCCTTCTSASCTVSSVVATTAALGQTNISAQLANDGNQYGTTPLTPGQSKTICVPVTVPAGSTMLGFKQKSTSSPGGCGDPTEQVITYQLKPASACGGAPITPNRTNASGVASSFNPEWDNLAPGNYVLCFTMNVTATALCNQVTVDGLGYYNVVPAAVTCQDYQIQMYSDVGLTNPITKTSFSCTEAKVFLGPQTFPGSGDFNEGLPYPAVRIEFIATSGSLANLVINRYNNANQLVETLSSTSTGSLVNYFLRPTGSYYSLDKTNAQSGTYDYIITDVFTGAVLASGTWTIVAGAESAKSVLVIPTGSASYTGPGVVNGLVPNPPDDFTDDRGLGYFDPAVAGAGSHTITYTWNNGLPAPNNCSLVRTMNVTVTGTAAPTASVTTQPTCTAPKGTITVTTPVGANFQYSIDGINYQSSTSFTSLDPGNYNVTVKHIPSGCISAATALTVNALPAVPAAPTASVTTQPTCTTPTGVITITAPIGANFEYSINGTTYQSGTGFSGLNPGNYNVTVRNTTTGCVSAASALTVNALPAAPAAPTASVTTQPTCTTPTGVITITAPIGANFEYSINGTTYQSGTGFSGLNPGNYNATVRNTTTGCLSTATSLTVNAVPTVSAPAASVSSQPSCTTPTGTITISSPIGANFEYSINGTTYQSGTGFSGLNPGNYNVTVRNTTTGCVSALTSLTINAVPTVSAPPQIGTPDKYCIGDVAVPVRATGTNLIWYTAITGGAAGSSTAPTPSTASANTFTYYVTQTVSPQCESNPRVAVTVVVNPLPIANAGPDKQVIAGGSVLLNGSASGSSISILWTPPTGLSSTTTATPTASPSADIKYTMTVRSADGCVATDDVNVVVLRDIIVPNIFSPNGDGVHDKWVIRYIEQYPNCIVEIYNRYGTRLFERRGYNSSNAWDGLFNGSPLPVGAYYYVIRLNNGKKALSGVVSIVR